MMLTKYSNYKDGLKKMKIDNKKLSRDLINGGHATLEQKMSYGRRQLFPPSKRPDNAANYQPEFDRSLKE